MNIFQGDMWRMWGRYDTRRVVLVTTNASLTRNGTLVMGRGAAAQAKRRCADLPKVFGRSIADTCGSGGRYGLLLPEPWPTTTHGIGAFQVKYHWREPADEMLIELSAWHLKRWCQKNPHHEVHLNYPGIGNGGLPIHQVQPILNGVELPDSVYVWVSTWAEWSEARRWSD